jgi:RNA recognition motif-containing protein
MSSSLFVGNIAYGAMEKEIEALFSQYGTVQDVRFIMDYQKGRFRGFGFVTMPKQEAATAIRELNKTEFQGRTLIVKEARQSPDAQRRSA